ncbi:hypothetical protein BDR07DRAFT_1385820 [Suillus spraguei]|nr:hypothetical protein BDR07DRAFT_1385820 [Suillus spraguei]
MADIYCHHYYLPTPISSTTCMLTECKLHSLDGAGPSVLESFFLGMFTFDSLLMSGTGPGVLGSLSGTFTFDSSLTNEHTECKLHLLGGAGLGILGSLSRMFAFDSSLTNEWYWAGCFGKPLGNFRIQQLVDQ